MNKRNYALEFLNNYGLIDSKVVKTPFDPFIKVQVDHDKLFPNIVGYRQLVVRLLYLSKNPSVVFVSFFWFFFSILKVR